MRSRRIDVGIRTSILTRLMVTAVAVASAIPVLGGDDGVIVSPRLVFVTSVSGRGDLGDPSIWPDNGGFTGLAAADAVCRARATAGGLPSPSEFIAWMSDSSNDAYCRIHGFTGTVAGNCGGLPSLPSFAGPWIRTDGHSFAEVVDEMLDPVGRVFVSARLDEYGVPTGGTAYFTGTDGVGLYFGGASDACAGWTSTTSLATIVGSPHRSTHSWSLYGSTGCQSERELLCMQTGAGPGLPSILNYGGLAFVTSVQGQGRLQDWPEAGGNVGVAAADAVCRSRAAAGGLRFPNSFKAWISTSTMNAPDRFSFNGPWVRLDGVVVAQSKVDLIDGEIFGPINQNEFGAYVANYFVLTGTDSSGVWGTEDCDGWTSALTTDFTTTGSANDVMRWTDQGYGNQCSHIARLYCLSEVAYGPVVFFDGFESNSTTAWSDTNP
jgi:hypothetical protein